MEPFSLRISIFESANPRCVCGRQRLSQRGISMTGAKRAIAATRTINIDYHYPRCDLFLVITELRSINPTPHQGGIGPLGHLRTK